MEEVSPKWVEKGRGLTGIEMMRLRRELENQRVKMKVQRGKEVLRLLPSFDFTTARTSIIVCFFLKKYSLPLRKNQLSEN